MRAGFSKKIRTYIPKSMRSETSPAEFQIRRLNPVELQDIADRFSDPNELIDIELGGIDKEKPAEGKEAKTIKVKVGAIARLTKAKYAVLEVALSGWANVEDEDGQAIEFSKENIPFLDPEIVNELSDIAEGRVTLDEAKNSATPSA